MSRRSVWPLLICALLGACHLTPEQTWARAVAGSPGESAERAAALAIVPAQTPPAVATLEELSTRDLAEASGLVADRRQAQRFWALNDSGNGPNLYTISGARREVRRYALPELNNVDWEDLSWMYFRGADYLVVGDIGDNRARRAFVQLHFFKPPPDEKAAVQRVHSLRLRYPDGPRDAESLAYDPRSKQLIILSKRSDTPHLYALDVAQALESNEMTLTRVGALAPFPAAAGGPNRHLRPGANWPTAMDISPEGSHWIVLNYVAAYIYRRAPQDSLDDLLVQTPQRIALPELPQAEGVCFGKTATEFFVISEQLPTRLAHIVLSPAA